jgi:cell division protein FtsQ
MAGWKGWQEVKAQGADWLPVKYVRIVGAFQYIAEDKVKKVLRDHVINGFYNADIQQIQASVKALPWVDAVTVKRIWPDTIDIAIDEQRPIARWGDKALLNIKGESFKPDQINDFSDLALLDGPEGYEKKMLKVANELSAALTEQNMKLAEFQINERRAWNIRLRNKIVLNAGRNQPLKKIQRFLNTISLITEKQIAKIEIVDLRYSNGYALTWKQGEATVDWKKIAEINKAY